MKTTGIIIIALIVSLVLITGTAIVVKGTNDSKIDSKDNLIGCTGCANSCTQEQNCGLATCGALAGKTCNCGK